MKPEEQKEVELMAEMVVTNPKLREDYFSNPSRVMAQMLPGTGIGPLELRTTKETKEKRNALASNVIQRTENNRTWNLSRETAAEKMFLQDAMRNPQRTFNAVLILSYATFLVGIALVVGAFIAGFNNEDTTLVGLTGGGSLIATLGTVFLTSRKAIRRVNGDNAQIRVILSSFASEMANLRMVEVKNIEGAEEVNKQIRLASYKAVLDIEKFAEPKGEGKEGEEGKQQGKQGEDREPDG